MDNSLNEFFKKLDWECLFDKHSNIFSYNDLIFVVHGYNKFNFNKSEIIYTVEDKNELLLVKNFRDIKKLTKPKIKDIALLDVYGCDWHLQYCNMVISKGFLSNDLLDIDKFVAKIKSFESLTHDELVAVSYRDFYKYEVKTRLITVPSQSKESAVLGNCKRSGDKIYLLREKHASIFNFPEGIDEIPVDITLKSDTAYEISEIVDLYNDGNLWYRLIPYNKKLNRLNTRTEYEIPVIVIQAFINQGDISYLDIIEEEYIEKVSFSKSLNSKFFRAVYEYNNNLDINIIMNLEGLFKKHLDIFALLTNNCNLEALTEYELFLRNNYDLSAVCNKYKTREIIKTLLKIRNTEIGINRFKEESEDAEYLAYKLSELNESLFYITDSLRDSGYDANQIKYIKYLVSNGESYDYLSPDSPVVSYELLHAIHVGDINQEIGEYLINNGSCGSKTVSDLWYSIEPRIKMIITNQYRSFGDFTIGTINYQDFLNYVFDNVRVLSFYQKLGLVLKFNDYLLQVDDHSLCLMDLEGVPIWRVIKLHDKIISSLDDISSFVN